MQIGELTVKATSDMSDVARQLRIIAKHAQACADELDPPQIVEGPRQSDSGPKSIRQFGGLAALRRTGGTV